MTDKQTPRVDFNPIIFSNQDFQVAITMLRKIADRPLPDEADNGFGRRLYYTDAINDTKEIRVALKLLGQ